MKDIKLGLPTLSTLKTRTKHERAPRTHVRPHTPTSKCGLEIYDTIRKIALTSTKQFRADGISLRGSWIPRLARLGLADADTLPLRTATVPALALLPSGDDGGPPL